MRKSREPTILYKVANVGDKSLLEFKKCWAMDIERLICGFDVIYIPYKSGLM